MRRSPAHLLIAIAFVVTTSLHAIDQAVPPKPASARADQKSEIVPQPPTPQSLAEAQTIIDGDFTLLQDWPQLRRYAEANSALPPVSPGEKRVVFLGDSITDIWHLDEYFPGKHYINRGIGGQTTPQMLIRMRPDVIDLQPAVVVILAGTNDIAGNTGPMSLKNIEDNYASMSELATTHGIQVIFSSVLPVHDKSLRGPQSLHRSPEKIRALNAWLKSYCADHQCIYLDYYSQMLGPDGMLRPDLADDGLHPNDAGFKMMAPLAQKAIDQAIANAH